MSERRVTAVATKSPSIPQISLDPPFSKGEVRAISRSRSFKGGSLRIEAHCLQGKSAARLEPLWYACYGWVASVEGQRRILLKSEERGDQVDVGPQFRRSDRGRRVRRPVHAP